MWLDSNRKDYKIRTPKDICHKSIITGGHKSRRTLDV